MRSNTVTTSGDTPLAALMRETAAATVDTVLAELRRRPIVHPEWLSLQDAAAYTGYSEQQFSEFVKRGIAPKSVLFSRNARRFKRSDVDAWCAGRAPMPPRASLALCTDEQDHTLFAARP
jgi:predicted DNA-binding transcriptional regulator AlpA